MKMYHEIKWKCNLEKNLNLWSWDAKESGINSHVSTHTLFALLRGKHVHQAKHQAKKCVPNLAPTWKVCSTLCLQASLGQCH